MESRTALGFIDRGTELSRSMITCQPPKDMDGSMDKAGGEVDGSSTVHTSSLCNTTNSTEATRTQYTAHTMMKTVTRTT